VTRPNSLFASSLSSYSPAWWAYKSGSVLQRKHASSKVKEKPSRAVKSCGRRIKVKLSLSTL
jgi:hypothetical protein